MHLSDGSIILAFRSPSKMESSCDITEVLPLEILVVILSFIPGMSQVAKLVSRKMFEVSSMVEGEKIPCIEYAAEIGSLKLVEWLIAQGCRDCFLLGAVRGGHLEIIKYSVKKRMFKFTYNVYKEAIRYGRVDILNYFVKKDLFSEECLFGKNKIIGVHNPDTLEWIFKQHLQQGFNFILDFHNECSRFAYLGEYDMIEKAIVLVKRTTYHDHRRYVQLGCAFCKGVFKGKRDDIMEFLLKNGFKLNDMKVVALASAIQGHDLAFYEKWFGEIYKGIDKQFVYHAMGEGCPKEMLKKLIVCSDASAYEIWKMAIEFRHVYIFELLEELFGRFQSLLENEEDDWESKLWDIIELLVIEKNIDMLDWFYANTNLNIFDRYAPSFNDNEGALEWFIKKGIDKCYEKVEDEQTIVNYLKDYHRYYIVCDAIGASITKYCLLKGTFRILHILMKKDFPLDSEIIYQFAINNNDCKLLLWVLDHYEGVSGNEKLELCALKGDLERVIKRLKKGDLFEEKIVGWAAKMGHRNVVHWLTVNVLIPKFMN
jgi:hypothetical protein